MLTRNNIRVFTDCRPGVEWPLLHWGFIMEAVNTKSRGRVLAIDDEPELLEIVKGSLEPHGFEVHTAVSAKEGVEFYERNWRDIDLVLLDFLMPDMTGDLVFECLKRENPDVRTILLTGCEDTVAERMFKDGLKGYIHKPFALEDFVREVGDAVDAV